MQGNGGTQHEIELRRLLFNLEPMLVDEVFVFARPKGGGPVDLVVESAFAVIRETEGTTFVCSPEFADAHSLEYDGLFQCIKLGVTSPLHAVGLTAAVASALAAEGLSANVIAAFHHDYVLVPLGHGGRALDCLLSLARTTQLSATEAQAGAE